MFGITKKYNNIKDNANYKKIVDKATTELTAKITSMVISTTNRLSSKLYDFTKNQITTELVLSDSYEMSMHYNSLLAWATKQKGVSKFCRNYTMRSSNWWADNKFTLGMGYGTSFFLYKKKLCWLRQVKLPSQGSEREKSEIKITCLTRNKAIIENMVEEFRYKRKQNELYVYTYRVDGWEVLSPIIKREMKTVIMDLDLKTKIISSIDYFLKNKSWFVNRGLPYKKTIVLHGPPGTGKTSFIKTVASAFDKNLYVINISQMSNSSFEKAISSATSNSIIVIEDFDSCKSTHSRKNKDEKDTVEDIISLTTILNTLDGIVSLNGTIIFMTTNHIEKIDEALLRKGRVDEEYEIKNFGDTEVKEYIHLMFPEKDISSLPEFSEISGCKIQSLFMESRGDFDMFISSIPKENKND